MGKESATRSSSDQRADVQAQQKRHTHMWTAPHHTTHPAVVVVGRARGARTIVVIFLPPTRPFLLSKAGGTERPHVVCATSSSRKNASERPPRRLLRGRGVLWK